MDNLGVDAHTKTDVGNDNNQRPKLASGKKISWTYVSSHWAIYSPFSMLCYDGYVEAKWAYCIFRSSMNQSECDTFAGVIYKSWNGDSLTFEFGKRKFVILTKFTSLVVPVVILTKFTSVEVLGVVILTSSVVVRQNFRRNGFHITAIPGKL